MRIRRAVGLGVVMAATLLVGSAHAKSRGYESLFDCFRAVEAEAGEFGDPSTRFGTLGDGIYFLRSGGIRGRVTVFHRDGARSFRLSPRRAPAYLVGSVGGSPAFYVSFQKEGDAVAIEYLAGSDRRATALIGKQVELRSSRASTRALRSRLDNWLKEALETLKMERDRLQFEARPGAPGQIHRGEALELIRQRLGRLLRAEACASIKARRRGPSPKKLAAALKEVLKLARDYDASKDAASPRKESAVAAVAKVPSFPGAKTATTAETRCLGLDAWAGDYDVRLTFASATARDVIDFYEKRLGRRSQTTERGFRLILAPPSSSNPLGDRIEVIDRAPAKGCTEGTYKVQVTVFRQRKA